MYLFCIVFASAVALWLMNRKSNEDDDNGNIWN
jgi:hypothetical protein